MSIPSRPNADAERVIWFCVIVMSLLFNGLFSALDYMANARMLGIVERQEQRELTERRMIVDHVNEQIEEAARVLDRP